MLYLDIFDSQYVNNTPKTGVSIPNDMNYIRKLYTLNNEQITSYYKDRNYAVKNTHILSRFLGHFPVYSNYDPYRYVDYSLDKVKYLAKHFKFTSDIEKGIVHPDYFLGNSGEEIILASYEYFNPGQVAKNWTNEQTIYIIKHPRTDIRCLLPLGADDGNKSGLSTILINVPKLALQYREFKLQQIKNDLIGNPVLNTNYFVIKYVLSTCMKDMIDHSFLNIVMDRFYGREIVTPKLKHRFKIFEPTTQINRYADQTVDTITSKNMDYLNILRNIQLIFNKDASTLLCLPDIPATQQVKWSLIASRIDHMLFLFDVSKDKYYSSNRHYLNDWKRLAKRIQSDNLMDNKFSYQLETDMKDKIDKLTQV